ncbi:Probable protein phosphatase 2C 6 [Striga hermonthica]|uniref:protein-serine/threonine phosphatase n=1 Tax=Striga hermonthica TaxID=68872 RepID=A0A9N7R694_STRHE|nr:Probable protein phosphatase 2C 6 [Striga hermonthica]
MADGGGTRKYSCRTASETLEWIHAIISFLEPYRFFLDAHVVNFFKDRLWEAVDKEWMDCLRGEPVEKLLQIPSGLVQLFGSRTFLECNEVKALVSIGCCYNLLSEEGVKEADSRCGFPVSTGAKSACLQLGKSARDLACQSAERWRGLGEAVGLHNFELHVFRAAFQMVLLRNYPEVITRSPSIGRQGKALRRQHHRRILESNVDITESLPQKNCSTSATNYLLRDPSPCPQSSYGECSAVDRYSMFVKFCKSGLDRLGLHDSQDIEFSKEWKEAEAFSELVGPYWTLRASLGPVLETLLLLDSGGAAAAAAATVVAEERALQQIPGRLFSNGASRIASLYTQQGKKGTNQDAMIFWENFHSGVNKNATFCGVFDGHGPYGHMVARKVRDALPILLRSQWESKLEKEVTIKAVAHENGNIEGMKRFDDFVDEDGCESLEAEEPEKIPEMHMPLKKSILRAFRLMDKELKAHPTIDCFCSGTTAVTLIKQGQDLIIGNVGDSRAVLATRDKDNALVAVQLTVDLKPNLPREAARIQKCKGRVFALQDEPEVARVWLPNSDSPGLAMARAFGDFCLKDFGLISIPDVYHHHITEKDEFVILATDGVWDVLSNKEAVNIVASAPSQGTAARALVECATRAWRLKYPTSKTDDCAVVCLFLEHMPLATQDVDQEETNVLEEETRTVSSNVENQNEVATEKSSEIVPVVDEEKKIDSKSIGQSKRSLAECLSTAEDEEWSALEGITRVNSLLSLPRFSPFDKRSTSWRKWI